MQLSFLVHFYYICVQYVFNMEVATSTNHSDIITLYEASREYVWLRRVINYIKTSCGICAFESPTIIYEDNAACVAQM
jgi:hypothetical protein